MFWNINTNPNKLMNIAIQILNVKSCVCLSFGWGHVIFFFIYIFYLTMHSTHFIYGYVASDSERETRCRHIGYSFRLAARVLLYAPSHRQDKTYHSLWYTSRGALAGMRNRSMGPTWVFWIRQPIAPWANALTTGLHLAPLVSKTHQSAILAMNRFLGEC